MLSNYSIKRMIPRLIVAAILVNASYYLAGAAVDISNLLGYNLVQLFGSVPIGDAASNASTAGSAWVEITSAILLAGVTIALIALVIVSPTVLIAVGIVALILVARKALIILLIVIAPVAFVAWLLPNTEDWFKKWWKMFFALLMVFPVIALVFGASELASNILMEVAEKSSDGEDTQYMLKVAALATKGLGLFAIPSLLKGAIAAAGTVGGKLQGYADRAQGNAMNTAKKRASDAGGNMRKDIGSRWKIAANSDRGIGRKLGGVTRWNTRRRKLREAREGAAKRAEAVGYSEELADTDKDGNYTKRAQRLQQKAAGGKVAGDAARTRAAAAATQTGHKQFDDDVSSYKTTMTGKSNEELLTMMADTTLSEEQRSAAAGMIMSRNHRESHLKALEYAGQAMQNAEKSGNSDEVKRLSSMQKQMSADMRDKPFALGDQAAGQLQTGDYGKTHNITDDSGNVVDTQQLGDIRKELNDRVATKMSASSLANMNPDEMKRIHKAAMAGELTPEAMVKLSAAITEARSNPQMAALIKPEAAALHSSILERQAQHKAQQDAAWQTYVAGNNVLHGPEPPPSAP